MMNHFVNSATITGLLALSSIALAEKYPQIKPVIDAACVTCHNNSGGDADFFPFVTFEDIKGNQEAMAKALETGYMPQDNPTFKDTIDGKRLINWLRKGEDLFPPPVSECPPIPPPHPLMKDPRQLTYEEIAPIIKRSCGGCHNPSGEARDVPMTTSGQVLGIKKDMLKELERGSMPKGNREFRFSADGRALMGWLESGKN